MRHAFVVAVVLALGTLVVPATAGAVQGNVVLADRSASFALSTNAGPPASYHLFAPHAYAGVTQGQVVNGQGAELCDGDVSLASTDGSTSTYSGSLYCPWDDGAEWPHPVPPSQGTIPIYYYDSVVLTVGPTTWTMSGTPDWQSGLTETCQGVVEPPDGLAPPNYTLLDGPCTLTD